jgi:RNA polymerase sigma-70 factor (ECF subfamily)
MAGARSDPGLGDGPGLRFDNLYEAHFQAVYAFVARRTRQTSDVADLVSEVFTVAWRKLADVPEPPADRWWLYATARRVVATDRRTRDRRSRLEGRLQNELSRRLQIGEGDPGLEARVAELVGQLRTKDREVLELVLWEQLSHAEAAAVLGCSVNAATVRYHRALNRLRDQLGRSGMGSDDSTAGEGR